MSAGKKILDGLKDAVAGRLYRVHIPDDTGTLQTWVRVFSETKTLTAEQHEALIAAAKALLDLIAGTSRADRKRGRISRGFDALAALRAAGIKLEEKT